MTAYLLDKDGEHARRRLSIKERLQDPATIAHLEAIGVGEGWRCLEIGAGGGSIAEYLCRRVGPTGHVVATDIDIGFLESLEFSQLEVRQQDAATDALPQAAFDVAHARDVLVHLPEREQILRRIANAIKPGGWILVEEPDLVTETADPTSPELDRQLYAKALGAIRGFLTGNGLDLFFGARLPGLLRSYGFEEVHADGRVSVFLGGTAGTESPHMMAFAELSSAVVSRGLVTDGEFRGFLELPRNPLFAWREGLTVFVRGRRPKGT